MKDAGSFSERFSLLQTELADRVKGSADVFAQSAAGKIETYKRQIGELQKNIGEQLMPVYKDFLSLSVKGIAILKELNFGSIIKSVIALTAAWGIYKTVVLANNIVTSVSNSLLVANAALSQGVAVKKMLETASEEVNTAAKSSNIIVTYAIIAAQKIYTFVTEAATVATRILSIAIKSTPIGWILTGIGLLAGAIAAYGSSVKSSTDAIDKNSESLERNKRIKELNADLDITVKKNMIDQKTVIDELVGKIKNHNLSLGDRKKALNELIELDPNYLQGLTLENIETAKGIGIINDYVAALERKARLEDITDRYNKAVSKELDSQKKLDDAGGKVNDLQRELDNTSLLNAPKIIKLNIQKSGFIGSGAEGDVTDALKENMNDRHDKEYWKKRKDEAIEEIRKEAEKHNGKDVQFTQNSGLGHYGGGDSGKGKAQKEKEWLAEIMKTRIEVNKEQIEQEKLKAEQLKKAFEENANDEKQSFEIRKQNLMMFLEQSKKIVDLQSQQEETETKDKLKEIERIEQKAAGKRTGEEKKLLIEKAALLEKLKTLELKHAFDVENIQIDVAKKLAQLAKQQADQIQSQKQKQKEDDEKEQQGKDKHQIDNVATNLLKDQTDLITEETDKLDALNRKYLEGKISVEQYNKAKQKLGEEFQVKNLDLEIKSKEILLQTLRDIVKHSNANTDAQYLYSIQQQIPQVENQLANLEKNRAEHGKKKKENNITKFWDEYGADIQQGVGYAQQLQSSIQSLVDDGYQAELNALQKKKDLQDESFTTELSNIEKSNLSQQDKAAMTVQLQAQQKAADKQIEKEQRDIKNRQARADRAFSIANIIENTATAVMAQLSIPGAGWVMAALVAAMGAVQLATVLAKPIPQYAEGTENHPGGLAVVGEGKHKELVSTPQGSFIAAKPMLIDLPRGTTVQPLTGEDITQLMYQSSMRRLAQLNQNAEIMERRKNNESWEIARWQTEQMKKAVRTEIKNKIKVETKIDYGFTEYINKQVFGKK